LLDVVVVNELTEASCTLHALEATCLLDVVVVNELTEASCTLHALEATCLLYHLNAELKPICYLLALLGAHHFLHVSRIRVKRRAS